MKRGKMCKEKGPEQEFILATAMEQQPGLR
jgi:hypothetical protein